MLKKYLLIAISVFVLGAWSIFRPDPVNIYDEPRQVPARPMFRYAETGQEYKLSDFKDNFVIAVFWSRHCVPCLRELKSLARYASKVEGNGIKVVIISPAGEWILPDEQQKFLTRHRAQSLDFYVDKKGDLAADLGIFTSPNTVLINKKGEEIGRIRGAVEWDNDDVVEYLYKVKAQHG